MAFADELADRGDSMADDWQAVRALQPRTADDTGFDWDQIPRLLNEICEGGCARGYVLEAWALNLPTGRRLWVCKSCFGKSTCPPAVSMKVWMATQSRPEQAPA